MRIAIVVDYSLDLIGGAQRAVLNQAAVLTGAGHHVLLIGPRPRGAAAALPPGVSTLWTAGPVLPLLGLPLVADDHGLRDRLRHRMRVERIDAVHLHSELGHAAAARAAARRLGLPVVQTVHTAYWPDVPAPLRPATRALLTRLAGAEPVRTGHPLLDRTLAAADAADVVVSPSAHQAADLVRLGVPDPVVVPNCDPSGAVATPLPGGPALRVAWIGRCVPEKRLLPFLRGVALARRRLPADSLRVTVAGDGVLLPVARALHAGAPGLLLAGRLERPAVQRLIEASHLSALTSHGFDNQPMTVVESVRAGRGVLHTDPRLAEGMDPALLTATPDAEGIADLLVALALDPARVRRSAERAQAAAALFSPQAHLAALLPLLAGTARLAA